MNKVKTGAAVKRVTHPPYLSGSEVKSAHTEASPSGTLNVRQMMEDAARVSDHIANGDKLEELSGIRFFRPSGLSDQ